jgi:protein kinase-like protein
LMDFGTGRDACALEAPHGRDIGGTPLYMAPEVLDRQPASPCNDVYSVGVLLYRLVTGEYPVEAETLEALGAAHREGRRLFVSEARADLTPCFVRVIERALASKPEERYPNAGALLNALSCVFPEIESTRCSTTSAIVTAAVVVVSAATGLLALGVLMSGAFNLTLERSDFAAETIWNWWLWGLRAHAGPALLLALGCIAAALFTVAVRLACSVSPAAARVGERVGGTARRWAHRLSLDQAPVLGSWVLLLSSGGLVVSWWYFSPLIVALYTKISGAPAGSHALLSPAFEPYHDHYRQTLSSLIILTGSGWYAVTRVAAAGRQAVHRGIVAGGAAVMMLALASLDFPYRLIVHNKFEAANWNGAECYILGERVDDVLLFCPQLQPPRNRVIQKSMSNLQRLGRRENIFTRAREP